MCLDAGAEFQGYASDVTRTFPISGNWPSKESKQIYDLVQRMQTKCMNLLGPGRRFVEAQYLAHMVAIEGLLELGIFHNGSKMDIYKAGTSIAFFPHGLGHHMGLEVHDVSTVLTKRSDAYSTERVAPEVHAALLQQCRENMLTLRTDCPTHAQRDQQRRAQTAVSQHHA
jgi:Xaa-Pro aminopeptidase